MRKIKTGEIKIYLNRHACDEVLLDEGLNQCRFDGIGGFINFVRHHHSANGTLSLAEYDARFLVHYEDLYDPHESHWYEITSGIESIDMDWTNPITEIETAILNLAPPAHTPPTGNNTGGGFY